MPYIHPLAFVCGDVTLGEDASVWPFAVLRGDSDAIVVGAASNVQDGAVLHADPGFPCTVGARVTIGHRAVVHGCTVEDDALVGMGAIVLNGAVIGAGSLIGAGAVVREGQVIPPGSVVLGVPARVTGAVTAELRARIAGGARTYVERARAHAAGAFPGR
jgi:carbonic anhydrase/acetyltransferase-like protein (isoleucine patch superfamily)